MQVRAYPAGAGRGQQLQGVHAAAHWQQDQRSGASILSSHW